MPNQTARQILTINTGSSSLKVALYEAGRDEMRILSGEVERIGVPGGRFRLTDAHGATLIDQGGDLPDHGAALGVALAGLRHFRPELDLDAVGHRVVHGGIHYSEPQRITPELIAALRELIPIAPDHMPQAVQAIQAAVEAYPGLPQVACFDTAFHRHMPRTAQLYPLPRHLADEGVVRYGFHGLSYESIMRELRALAPREAEKPVVFAFHGYPRAMHEVLHGRTHAERFHVRGFIEEGTTTTPFDMVVLNKMSRFHLCIEALKRSGYPQAGPLIEWCEGMLAKHQTYTREHFEDLPEVRDWVWTDT